VTTDAGANRVNRGGSWNNDARNCRVANRDNDHPGNRDHNLGFRLLSTELRQRVGFTDPTRVP
jgi:formylglycine-generating enzyme required for sulfatase activity